VNIVVENVISQPKVNETKNIIRGINMVKYPELKDSKIIAMDIETYDPELKKHGPGVFRRDGNILGVAVATDTGFAEYYNMGHQGITAEEKVRNIKYITDLAKRSTPKLGTNILYDLDWLVNWLGIAVNGKLHDIQVAEPLINEYARHYNLDAQATKYLNKHKVNKGVIQFCKDHDLSLKDGPQPHLYLMPYELVRSYAIGDVRLPLEIFKKQWVIMHQQNLLDVYHMEIGLLPLLLQMRRVGVPIDIKQINNGISRLTKYIRDKEAELFRAYGEFNYNSSQQLANILDKMGIEYDYHPPTKKMLEKGITQGNPMLDADALSVMNNPFIDIMLEVKVAKKTRDTFLINALSGHNINSRIHAQFFPLKNDEYGTVSGRFSSANPNLQQIPARNARMNEICRSCFIPEEDMLWGKIDLSQIEYRIISHYAEGPKSDMIREKYRKDPKTDYHEFVMGISGLKRKPAKNLNFGAAYCMGPATCAKKFRWTLEQATEFLETYHKEVPFVAYTRDKIIKIAKGRGYLKTISGRRARVSELMRANRKEYSMFNRLIQGTAADILKKGMLTAYEAGIFDILIPHLTVHDELDNSIPRTKEGVEAYKELQHILEYSIELRVPIIAVPEIGKNWHDVKPIENWKKVI
jgi:DNA polymerase I-like protein with 3'-5' exonuclease and polymerase domains